MRLVKLLRILRASRIVGRWKDYIGLSFAQVTMIEFVTMTIFLVHMMACLWAYIGINWVPTCGTTLEFETTWIKHYGFEVYQERGASPRPLPRGRDSVLERRANGSAAEQTRS